MPPAKATSQPQRKANGVCVNGQRSVDVKNISKLSFPLTQVLGAHIQNKFIDFLFIYKPFWVNSMLMLPIFAINKNSNDVAVKWVHTLNSGIHLYFIQIVCN